MKSSKHVETCFVRANNDFDDKLTAFWMKNNFWTKIPQYGHCAFPISDYVINECFHSQINADSEENV